MESKRKLSSPFRFRQFTVTQHENAHKIGTDSVVLACFLQKMLQNKVDKIRNVLDIGTGTGILAMFSAVFFKIAKVDAVEINKGNATEAQLNVNQNHLDNQVKVYHTALQNFTPQKQYDLIITNPPYFENAVKNNLLSHQIARHSSNLSLTDILAFAGKYLSKSGYLSFIVPQNVWNKYKMDALEKFWLKAELQINNRNTVLTVVVLSKQKEGSEHKETLYIRNNGGSFTDEFIRLTENVYLPEVYRGRS